MAAPLGLALVLLATGCVGRMVRDEDSCHQARHSAAAATICSYNLQEDFYLLIFLIQSRFGF